MKLFKQFMKEQSDTMATVATTPMIDVDGVQKHRHNSEGKPIHHTDEGIKNFHKWFGDSKAVDEHGRPQVHYHGTGTDIHRFNEVPVWLSKKPPLASEYANHRGAWDHEASPNVMPLYAKTHKTFDADKLPNTVTVNKFYSELHSQANKPENTELLNKHRIDTVNAARNEESGPHYSKKDFWHHTDSLFGKSGKRSINAAIHASGFDSIKHNEEGHETIGLMSSHQVKSAIGNNGEFKLHTNKITESSIYD